MTVAVIRLESTSLLFVSCFFQHLFTLSIMEADVAGGHFAVAAGDARKPRKSSSSAVAEGVWGKGLAGTPEPKVAIGIQGRGPSPPNGYRGHRKTICRISSANTKDSNFKNCTSTCA